MASYAVDKRAVARRWSSSTERAAQEVELAAHNLLQHLDSPRA